MVNPLVLIWNGKGFHSNFIIWPSVQMHALQAYIYTYDQFNKDKNNLPLNEEEW